MAVLDHAGVRDELDGRREPAECRRLHGPDPAGEQPVACPTSSAEPRSAARRSYYRGSVAGSFTITNALTDVGSGPASSTTSALTGTTTGWTHTPSTVSTPTGGPYVSNTFSWVAGTTGSPTETVTGRDLANNTAITTGSLVNDSTPPTGSISYGNGYQVGKYVTLTFSGADSGVRAALRRSCSASPRTSATADARRSAPGPTSVRPNPVSPYTDSTVTNSMCYNYRYVLTDLVGNVLTATSASTAWVDYAGAVEEPDRCREPAAPR